MPLPPEGIVSIYYIYLLGHVFPLHNIHLKVLFWSKLTKWDVNSSDHNPYSVGDGFSNLPGEVSTFFLFQLGLKHLWGEKHTFGKPDLNQM